jgi:hypothetical protein
MSLNLHLLAQREVQTSSGRKENEQLKIELLQTPSKLSGKLIQLEDFDLILDGYCEWADSDYHYEIEYYPVFQDNQHSTVEDEYEVLETINKNDEQFKAIDKHSIYSQYGTEDNPIIAYQKIKQLSHGDKLRKQIKDMRERDYYLYWEVY